MIIIILLIAIMTLELIVEILIKFKKFERRRKQDIILDYKVAEIKRKQRGIENNESYEDYYPYVAKYLLTDNEYNFFCNLKQLTDQYNLQILAKIRLADIIEVQKGFSYADYQRYFGKIKSKHIDFAIADNMSIVTLIELDDSSHNSPERQERDRFINNALYYAGYNLIRTYGDINDIANYLQNVYSCNNL